MSVTPLFDRLEDECDRLMREEGRMPKAIFLGKKQSKMFVDELLEIQEIPHEGRIEARAFIAKSEIKINDTVDVFFTEKEDEMRFETKKELLN
jgi:hypothetical protein